MLCYFNYIACLNAALKLYLHFCLNLTYIRDCSINWHFSPNVVIKQMPIFSAFCRISEEEQLPPPQNYRRELSLSLVITRKALCLQQCIGKLAL